MIEYQILRCFMDFALLIIGLWAIATLAVQLMFTKRKSRSRLEPAKRQTKLYIHSLSDDR